MKRIDWSSLDDAGRKAALARPARRTSGDVTNVVRDILDDVRERGGAADLERGQFLQALCEIGRS